MKHFKSLGYGIIAPDLLGYGGTSKPKDPRFYTGSGLADDINEILEASLPEGAQVITVAHDWGTRVASRLYNYFPHKVRACAFFGSGYSPPNSLSANPIAMREEIKTMTGYDVVAYMECFVKDETPALIEKNFDSFFSLLFPETSEIWIENMCVSGGAEAWLKANKTRESLPTHITIEEKMKYREALIGAGLPGEDHNGDGPNSKGMTAPLCWYKVVGEEYSMDDDKNVPSETIELKKPVLFVGFKDDPIGRPDFADAVHAATVKGPLTRKEVDGDHWAVMSHVEILDDMLLDWVNGLS